MLILQNRKRRSSDCGEEISPCSLKGFRTKVSMGCNHFSLKIPPNLTQGPAEAFHHKASVFLLLAICSMHAILCRPVMCLSCVHIYTVDLLSLPEFLLRSVHPLSYTCLQPQPVILKNRGINWPWWSVFFFFPRPFASKFISGVSGEMISVNSFPAALYFTVSFYLADIWDVQRVR